MPPEPTPSQPVVSDPQPVASKPQPVASKPQPVAPKPQPVQQQQLANSISVTPAESVDVDVAKSAPATEVASFHREELDGEEIIGSQPLLEVAAPEPQPIKSQLSAKERDRSRWQSQNRAHQRFLERLSKKANKNPPAN
jgi:hypothetical protein